METATKPKILYTREQLQAMGKMQDPVTGNLYDLPTAPTPVATAKEMGAQLGSPAASLGDIEKGLMDIRTNLGEITPTAQKDPGAIQDFSEMWETEYGKSGLEDVKTKVSGVDTDIAARKKQRDDMLLDEMGKPIPQWMITGRKKLEVDAATADLNQLIDQRNAFAGEYNTGISEIERKVNYAIDYQKELQKQLTGETEATQWEKDYALKLYEAQKPKETTLPTSYQEWSLAGKPGTFEEWLKTSDEYTSTQVRAKDRETELLKTVIEKYKADWPKQGDTGLGTREDLINRAMKEYTNLTADKIKNAVYGEIPNEWLTANTPKSFWQRLREKTQQQVETHLKK